MARGITRVVLLTRRYAFKLPRPDYLWGIRGWLANRSEWKQRHRPDVARPLLTLGHVVLVMPRGQTIATDQNEPFYVNEPLYVPERDGDEAKLSSWAMFPDGVARLVDFDRAWEHPRGLVGGWYYGRQEAMARRWIAEGARAE